MEARSGVGSALRARDKQTRLSRPGWIEKHAATHLKLVLDVY
jgi:hypothetical protein